MEDPVYLGDERVLSRMLASESRQEMESYFESRLQRDFSEQDRRELAIWMHDVCRAEECQPDIFPLSIIIVDRFLSFVKTKRTHLQLLGAVALLLASKLRQTSQIPAKHLIYYTQDLITLDELKTWELFVLTTLKWDLTLITPVDYLDILMRRMELTDEKLACNIEEEALRLIVECCFDYKYSLYPPSMIARACLLRAMDFPDISDDCYLTVSAALSPHDYHNQRPYLSSHSISTSNSTNQTHNYTRRHLQHQNQQYQRKLHQHSPPDWPTPIRDL